MALSKDFIEKHIAEWRERLTGPAYSYRQYWPSCLFHHTPIENAVSILATGSLRSRNDAENRYVLDVAAQEVNQNRQHAHDRVRLYFRPKTPTQFNIEGIRKTGECKFGEHTHAPVLVMLIIDARYVLNLPDTIFSDRNMQSNDAEPQDTEEYFRKIPFNKVYHEGPTGGDDTIRAHRCAEVLPTSPLNLDKCLKAVYFRSEPERDTLLYLLGDNRKKWAARCLVSDALKVFEKNHSFVQEIGLTSAGVIFTLNPRHDGAGVEVSITIQNEAGQKIASFYNACLAAAPPQGRWIYPYPLTDGNYLVKVEIEGKTAYHAPISLNSTLF